MLHTRPFNNLQAVASGLTAFALLSGGPDRSQALAQQPEPLKGGVTDRREDPHGPKTVPVRPVKDVASTQAAFDQGRLLGRAEGRLELAVDLLDEERAELGKKLATATPKVQEDWKRSEQALTQQISTIRTGLAGNIKEFDPVSELRRLQQSTLILVGWRVVADFSSPAAIEGGSLMGPPNLESKNLDLRGSSGENKAIDLTYGSVSERYLLQLLRPHLERALDGKSLSKPSSANLGALKGGVQGLRKKLLDEAHQARDGEAARRAPSPKSSPKDQGGTSPPPKPK